MNAHRRVTVMFVLAWGLSTGCQKSAEPRNMTSGFMVEGLQVIFKPTPGRDNVAMGFYLKGGSSYVSAQQAGIEALLLRSALRGTETRTHEALQSRMATLGAHLEVAPGLDHIGLTGIAPINNFADVWSLFTEILVRPRLDHFQIDWTRERIEAEITNARSDPQQRALDLARANYYAKHGYRLGALGNSTSLSQLTRNDLVQYYREDMTKNRSLLVIVGDLELKEVTLLARQLGRQLPRGPDLLIPSNTFDAGDTDVSLNRERISTHFIAGLFAAPRPGHAEYPAFLVALTLLQQRLEAQLRDRRGLVEEIRTWEGGLRANHGGLIFATSEPRRAVPLVRDAIINLMSTRIDDAELAGAIGPAMLAIRMSEATVSDQLAALAKWGVVAEDWRQIEQLFTELQAVRGPEVQAVVRRYIRRIHWGAIGPSRQLRREIFMGR